MPFAPAIIAAIVSAAATVGTTAYSAISSGNASDAAKKQAAELSAEQKAQAEKDAQTQQAQKQQLLNRAAPDAQAQTGGSLTGDALNALISQIAGQPGSAQQPFFSGSSGLSPGGTGTSGFSLSGAPDLDKLSQSLQGGAVS